MKLNDMTIADVSNNAHKNAERYPESVRNIVIQAFAEGACWAFNHLMNKGHDTAWFQQDPIPPAPSIDYLPIEH